MPARLKSISFVIIASFKNAINYLTQYVE